MTDTNITNRIGRHPAKEGPRSPVRNQTGLEKSVTGTNSPGNNVEDTHPEDTSNSGSLHHRNPNSKITRQKWSREEYIDVIEAYYDATTNPTATSTSEAAYAIWREKHQNERLNMDAKKLSNMRRYIIKSGKLSSPELELIKEKFENNNSIPETGTNPTSTTATETYTPTTQITVPHETQQQQACQEDPDIVELSTNILRRLECVKETKIADRQTIPKIKVHQAAKKIIRLANESLEYIKAKRGSPMTLSETNELIYATAATITEALGTRISTRKKKKNRPSWKVNIENDIKKLRSQLSALCGIEKDSKMKQQKKNKIKRQLKIKTKEEIPQAKEILKQRIQAKAQRLRRLTKRSNFFWHNKLFREDTKKLYRELNSNKIVVHSPPTIKEVEDFWSGIWETDKTHNTNAPWIQRQKELYNDLDAQQWEKIELNETIAAIKRTKN